MAELLKAAQANAETNKMEQVKADQELENVAMLIRDAINDGKFNTSTGHYGKLNWRTSDKLRQLGYSVQDWGEATLIEWKDIFSEHANSDEVKPASSEKEFNQSNPTKSLSLRYIGFSSHDCESWYECPTCKKRYSGWTLKNDGSEFECACGQKLYSPI